MKNILTVFFLSVIISLSHASEKRPVPKYKTVCKEVNKNNKKVQECKTIRVHRKLNGTKVPERQGK